MDECIAFFCQFLQKCIAGSQIRAMIFPILPNAYVSTYTNILYKSFILYNVLRLSLLALELLRLCDTSVSIQWINIVICSIPSAVLFFFGAPLPLALRLFAH